MSDDERRDDRRDDRAAIVGHGVKLPPFWAHAPGAWFAHAEAVFTVKHVTQETDKYCNLLASLQEDSLRLVLDIVEDPDQQATYAQLKERLLAATKRSNFERLEAIWDLPTLGAQKPSVMMAKLLELCPRTEQKSMFLAHHFLRRLPRELRLILATEDLTNLQALAAKADLLATHHPMAAPVAAAPELEDNSVAALQARSGRFSKGKAGQKTGRDEKRPARGDKDREARMAAGMCVAHWLHGSKAYSCVQPCSWPGNGLAGGQ